jgi:hypothetical protein
MVELWPVKHAISFIMPNACDPLWQQYQNMAGSVDAAECVVTVGQEHPVQEPLRDGIIIIRCVIRVISRETKATHVQFAAKLIVRLHIVKW